MMTKRMVLGNLAVFQVFESLEKDLLVSVVVDVSVVLMVVEVVKFVLVAIEFEC